jgi:HSP20 family molecular chaperone IbpA
MKNKSPTPATVKNETASLLPMPGNIFKSLFSFSAIESGRPHLPQVEMQETKSNVAVKVKLNGLNRKNIKLDIKPGMFTISGKHEDSHSGKRQDGSYFSEEHYAGFYRSFPLPEDVKTGSARTSSKNGVLTITLKKHNAKSNGGRQ